MPVDARAAHAAIDQLVKAFTEQEARFRAAEAAAQAKIKDLQRQLDALKPPPGPDPQPAPGGDSEPKMLVLGLDLAGKGWSQEGVATHRAMLGGRPLVNVRVFFQPGEAPTWNDEHIKRLTPADQPWLSTKTLTEQTLRAFLDAMPDAWKVPGRVYRFTHHHEGEADMLKSPDPAAAIKGYLDTYAMMQRVFAAHPNGKFFEPWKILLNFTQSLDNRPGFRGSWPRFVGDQDIPVGMDCYMPPSRPDYMPAEQLLGTILQIHEKTGLRIAVPEVGGVTKSAKRNDADGSQRAAAIQKIIAFARSTPIETMNWWCGEGAAGDHHLDTFPSNIAAWKDGMAHNPA